jgi:transposase
LTAELVATSGELFKAHPYVTTFAGAIGVDERTVYRWIRRGKDARRRLDAEPPEALDAKDTLAAAFCQAIKKALAEFEAEAVANVRRGGQNWQASAWILERRWPLRWGRGRALDADLKALIARVEKERKRSEDA